MLLLLVVLVSRATSVTLELPSQSSVHLVTGVMQAQAQTFRQINAQQEHTLALSLSQHLTLSAATHAGKATTAQRAQHSLSRVQQANTTRGLMPQKRATVITVHLGWSVRGLETGSALLSAFHARLASPVQMELRRHMSTLAHLVPTRIASSSTS